MNKIDVFLNSISQKHLQVEVLDTVSNLACEQARSVWNSGRIHAALLDAFEGGVRHAKKIHGASVSLIKEVDIDLAQLDR